MGDAQPIYRERLQRIRKTIALELLDRIPLVFMGTGLALRYIGVSVAASLEFGRTS